jgi:hypothetical protein
MSANPKNRTTRLTPGEHQSPDVSWFPRRPGRRYRLRFSCSDAERALFDDVPADDDRVRCLAVRKAGRGAYLAVPVLLDAAVDCEDYARFLFNWLNPEDRRVWVPLLTESEDRRLPVRGVGGRMI